MKCHYATVLYSDEAFASKNQLNNQLSNLLPFFSFGFVDNKKTEMKNWSQNRLNNDFFPHRLDQIN